MCSVYFFSLQIPEPRALSTQVCSLGTGSETGQKPD